LEVNGAASFISSQASNVAHWHFSDFVVTGRFPDALKIVCRQLVAPPYSLPVLRRMPAGLRFRGRSLRETWHDLRAQA